MGQVSRHLPKSTRKKSKGKDLANFDKESLLAIYGDCPTCEGFQCTFNATETHHIRTRGYKFGAKPSSEKRKIFSSIFNASPLCRHHHALGEIHRMDMEEDLLKKARNKVHDAMRRGDYTITDEDRLFLEIYSLI